MKQDAFYQISQDLSGPVLLLMFLGLMWIIIQIAFFMKIWGACSGIESIKEILESKQGSSEKHD